MNLLLILLLTYVTASLAANSSHRSDFHRLNIPLYAYVIFYTLIFIPQAIFMHVFYLGYVFMYFLPDFIIKIYPYRLYVTILFLGFYYLFFYFVIKITEKNLNEGKRHTVFFRMAFFSVLTIFLLVFLYKRVIYTGTIQDYLTGTVKPIYKSISGFLLIEYILLLFAFDRFVVPKIKRITI
ncbi:MAG: hypothetical protein N3B13_07155 [Deltaproteobacteria bacterium]|nr:hypothetical protein [Deltaproteobacteria bacterium]